MAEYDNTKRQAFLTGSHVYGTPNEGSDIDLVVLLSEEDHATLLGAIGEQFPIRFGRLNLIPFSNPDQFTAWKAATVAVKRRAKEQPNGKFLKRDDYIPFFAEVLEALGFPYTRHSGEPDEPQYDP